MVHVTFTYNWNGTLSTARTPKYVPATARSIGVSVNGGTSQFLNAPASTIQLRISPVADPVALISASDNVASDSPPIRTSPEVARSSPPSRSARGWKP